MGIGRRMGLTLLSIGSLASGCGRTEVDSLLAGEHGGPSGDAGRGGAGGLGGKPEGPRASGGTPAAGPSHGSGAAPSRSGAGGQASGDGGSGASIAGEGGDAGDDGGAGQGGGEPTEAFFRGLGHLSAKFPESRANGVSADGKSVVGWSLDDIGTRHGFRWQGELLLDLHPSNAATSEGVSTNRDGTRVALSVPHEGQVWKDGAFSGLGVGGGNYSVPTDTSADGTTIVGYAGVYVPVPHSLTHFAFRVVEGEAMQDLGALEGTSECVARATNGDGSIVVGYCIGSEPPPDREAFIWELGKGMSPLVSSASEQDAEAHGVSADGQVIVGSANVDGKSYPCYWDAARTLHFVVEITGASIGRLHGTNADGTVAIGWARLENAYEHVLWDEEHGLRPLRHVLSAANVMPDGWTLSVEDISADGKTVVGYGTNPDGEDEAFIARVP